MEDRAKHFKTPSEVSKAKLLLKMGEGVLQMRLKVDENKRIKDISNKATATTPYQRRMLDYL